jgi:transposase
VRRFQKAAEILGLDWHSVHQIMERAVQRGLQRRQSEGTRRVGIDEKSFKKGHSYITLMTDLEQGRVLEVLPERTMQACDQLYDKLGEQTRQNIEAVSMDMWEPFMNSTVPNVPQAMIVHDKFHVAKYLYEAVDQVRRKEKAQLQTQPSNPLTGTKYLWLKNPQNWTQTQRQSFESLPRLGTKVARAWQLKELFKEFWLCSDLLEAQSFFGRWYSWAIRSRLKPIKEVAKTIKTHLHNLLTYFFHPISNAMTEGFNSKIQNLKHAARGFRSFDNYRIRILFFCGKLHLHPVTH